MYTGVLPQQRKGSSRSPSGSGRNSLSTSIWDAHAMFEEIQQTLFERILPAVGALDVQEAETE